MHPIFMIARIPIFIIYAILTCCCDKGEVLDNEFPYDKLFISFDYIENNTPIEGAYQYRNWWEEWRSNQNVRAVRANVQQANVSQRWQNEPMMQSIKIQMR